MLCIAVDVNTFRELQYWNINTDVSVSEKKVGMSVTYDDKLFMHKIISFNSIEA